MTKKDYIKIANVLRFHKNCNRVKGADPERFRLLVFDMASMLKGDNPRFSRDKFTEYIFVDEVGAAMFVTPE